MTVVPDISTDVSESEKSPGAESRTKRGPRFFHKAQTPPRAAENKSRDQQSASRDSRRIGKQAGPRKQLQFDDDDKNGNSETQGSFPPSGDTSGRLPGMETMLSRLQVSSTPVKGPPAELVPSSDSDRSSPPPSAPNYPAPCYSPPSCSPVSYSPLASSPQRSSPEGGTSGEAGGKNGDKENDEKISEGHYEPDFEYISDPEDYVVEVTELDSGASDNSSESSRSSVEMAPVNGVLIHAGGIMQNRDMINDDLFEEISLHDEKQYNQTQNFNNLIVEIQRDVAESHRKTTSLRANDAGMLKQPEEIPSSQSKHRLSRSPPNSQSKHRMRQTPPNSQSVDRIRQSRITSKKRPVSPETQRKFRMGWYLRNNEPPTGEWICKLAEAINEEFVEVDKWFNPRDGQKSPPPAPKQKNTPTKAKPSIPREKQNSKPSPKKSNNKATKQTVENSSPRDIRDPLQDTAEKKLREKVQASRDSQTGAKTDDEKLREKAETTGTGNEQPEVESTGTTNPFTRDIQKQLWQKWNGDENHDPPSTEWVHEQTLSFNVDFIDVWNFFNPPGQNGAANVYRPGRYAGFRVEDLQSSPKNNCPTSPSAARVASARTSARRKVNFSIEDRTRSPTIIADQPVRTPIGIGRSVPVQEEQQGPPEDTPIPSSIIDRVRKGWFTCAHHRMYGGRPSDEWIHKKAHQLGVDYIDIWKIFYPEKHNQYLRQFPNILASPHSTEQCVVEEFNQSGSGSQFNLQTPAGPNAAKGIKMPFPQKPNGSQVNSPTSPAALSSTTKPLSGASSPSKPSESGNVKLLGIMQAFFAETASVPSGMEQQSTDIENDSLDLPGMEAPSPESASSPDALDIRPVTLSELDDSYRVGDMSMESEPRSLQQMSEMSTASPSDLSAIGNSSPSKADASMESTASASDQNSVGISSPSKADASMETASTASASDQNSVGISSPSATDAPAETLLKPADPSNPGAEEEGENMQISDTSQNSQPGSETNSP